MIGVEAATPDIGEIVEDAAALSVMMWCSSAGSSTAGAFANRAAARSTIANAACCRAPMAAKELLDERRNCRRAGTVYVRARAG
jgi:hypothetical protein